MAASLRRLRIAVARVWHVADPSACSKESEEQTHFDEIPEFTIGAADMVDEASFQHKAELQVQGDRCIVMGENAEGELVQAS